MVCITLLIELLRESVFLRRGRRELENEIEILKKFVIQIRLAMPSFEKIFAARSSQFPGSADRRFEFQKRGQLFIGVHNEALSVAIGFR
jgi:hypothetical protein